MPVLVMKLDADRNGGLGVLKGADYSRVIHLTDDAPIEVGTLRGGMQSGKDSCAFAFTLPDGRAVIAETSVELFLAAARAIKAWQEGRRERGEP